MMLAAGPHPCSRSKVDTETVVMAQTTEERTERKHKWADKRTKGNAIGGRASVRWFLVSSSDQDILNGTKSNSLRKELRKQPKSNSRKYADKI